MAHKIETVRTTAFRLLPEHFGSVHLYCPGERFTRVWEVLTKTRRHSSKAVQHNQLPYHGLAVALRVLSGDLVFLNRMVGREKAFIVSRRPINRDDLAMVVQAWEANVLGNNGNPISNALDDLSHHEVSVADYIHRRPGQCPTISDQGRWVWDVGLWEVSHRLGATSLETDAEPVYLRMDSEGALLTWNHLVQRRDKDDAAAMHKLTLKMITIPGIEEPVASISSSLVRLAPSWRAAKGAKYAWADLHQSGPILRAQLRHIPSGDSWETFWKDNAVQVLRGACLAPLPATHDGPSLTGSLRTGYHRPPRYHPIGKGVGIWFHECVAHHIRRTLGPGAQGVELSTLTQSGWPTRKKAAPRLHLGFDYPKVQPGFRLLVIYATSEVRRRVRDALAYVLSDEAHAKDISGIKTFCDQLRILEDKRSLGYGPVQVTFVKPPQSSKWLLERNKPKDIEAWLMSWLPFNDEAGQVAAVVETDLELANGNDGLKDPKPVLRKAMAQKGIVTQFITKNSAPADKKQTQTRGEDTFQDHSAANSIGDLMRSAGFFLRQFPEFGCLDETVVVGVYGAGLKNSTMGKKGQQSFLVNLIAVKLGTREAWGYTVPNGWSPVHEATAWFLANENRLSFEEAKQRVEKAIGQLHVAIAPKRAILLFNALGCRRFWPCLTDKSGRGPESWMLRNNSAVVRIRAVSDEVPRPAGVNEWGNGFDPAKHTDFRPMTVVGSQGKAPMFVLSGSAVMSRGQSARKSTRLAASGRALKEDWHSLGTTELYVLDPGEWAVDDVYKQVAMLCRIAPTWDRTLRWPSPLHLARAVARDHPHAYFSESDAEEDGE